MRVKAVFATALFVLLLAVPAQAEPGLRLGFSDIDIMQHDPAQRPLELQHLKSTRASTLRLMWKWSEVELAKPPSKAVAEDPNWSGYNWSILDATLRDVAAAGVTPVVEVSSAPAWHEGANRPPVSEAAPAGTWKPDPVAYGSFMHAAALRYSGRMADPLRPGQNLPTVRFWQIWNEPNLPVSLSPQWSKSGSSARPVSPNTYRAMLASAYTQVKSASSATTILTAGTAPFGEPKPGGSRMPPARFVRELLCVSSGSHPKARNCRRTPAKFDILAHHPYPIGPPGRHAINRDDVTVPDFAKLQKPLAVALKAGNVYPRKRKPIWVTEMSWDSAPPDPGGVEVTRQARYAAGAMYVLWRQGVKTLLWWNLRDDVIGDNYKNTLQSGVFYRGKTVALDTPKPLLTAFQFPFTAFGSKRGAKLWGMAPASGSVQIQRQSGTDWKTVRTIRAGSNRIFQLRIKASSQTRFRAVQNGEPSIDAKIL